MLAGELQDEKFEELHHCQLCPAQKLTSAVQNEIMASPSGLKFYLKIAAPCFCLGAGMEMFMLKTGFYEK